MKTIIIAEKPDLAVSIVKAIGKMNRKDGYFENENYIVTFAIGHLLTLKDIDDYLNRKKAPWKLEELPFIPDEFQYKVSEDSGLKKQFKIVEKLINRKDIGCVVNCGDADKEGQVIIDSLIKFSGCKCNNIKRLWLQSTTTNFIKEQLNIMKNNDLYSNLYNEGLLRAYMDWLLGINLTRYITVKKSSLYPVGRVLIPIVKFIYDRDMSIDNFIKEKYYTVASICEKDGIEFKLEIKDPVFKIDEESIGNELIDRLNKEKAIVKSIKDRESKKQPGKLFSLSKAQSFISKNYGISFVDSLEIIQRLYEKGFLTYPRTNSQYLTEDEKGFVKKVISSLQTEGHKIEYQDKKTVFDTSKVESHSALTPTEVIPKLEELSENERIVYLAIRNRFIINFLTEDTIISIRDLNIRIKDFDFKLKGEIIKAKGMYEYEPIKEKENILPVLVEGELIDVDFKLCEKETTPPKHITDEGLSNYLEFPYRKANTTEEEEFKALTEGLEIGTQATRTKIIENAKKYGYIKEKNRIYTIEPKGIELIETLNLLNINLYVDRTVEFSKMLKMVYRNEIEIESCIEEITKELKSIVYRNKDINIKKENSFESEKEIIGKCMRCGRNVYENAKSFYCEGYNKEPKCTFSIWKEDRFFSDKGKKITKIIARNLLKKGYVELKGLKKKNSNSTYNAKVEIIDTGKYVNFKLKF